MSGKLVLTLNGATLLEYILDKELITIGRRADNDITIDNLAISSRHCQIITILNESFLEDLNSTNGTYVNGDSIKKHALMNGDVIGIGKNQLKYIADPDQDDAEALITSLGEKISAQMQIAQLQTPEPKAERVAKLQALNGSYVGQEIIVNKGLTTIGKAGAQVAAITQRPTGFFIVHVEGGANGSSPLVNGKSIGTQAHSLEDMDIVEVSGTKYQFTID